MPPSRYRYDAGAARYRRATGQFVADVEVLAEVDRVLLRGEAELLRIAGRLSVGRVTVRQWLEESRGLLRDLHVAAAAAGSGGRHRMDAVARGQVGGRLRIQYVYLERFAGELAAGLPRGDAFLARVRLYLRAVRTTYGKALARAKQAAGYTIQRNRERRGAEHCGECEGLTGAGWVPIGSQPDPGERECGPGCQCWFEYRRVLPGAA